MNNPFARSTTSTSISYPAVQKIGSYRVTGYNSERAPIGTFASNWNNTMFPVSIGASGDLRLLSNIECRLQDYYNIRTDNLERKHKDSVAYAQKNQKISRRIRTSKVNKMPVTINNVGASSSNPVTNAGVTNNVFSNSSSTLTNIFNQTTSSNLNIFGKPIQSGTTTTTTSTTGQSPFQAAQNTVNGGTNMFTQSSINNPFSNKNSSMNSSTNNIFNTSANKMTSSNVNIFSNNSSQTQTSTNIFSNNNSSSNANIFSNPNSNSNSNNIFSNSNNNSSSNNIFSNSSNTSNNIFSNNSNNIFNNRTNSQNNIFNTPSQNQSINIFNNSGQTSINPNSAINTNSQQPYIQNATIMIPFPTSVYNQIIHNFSAKIDSKAYSNLDQDYLYNQKIDEQQASYQIYREKYLDINRKKDEQVYKNTIIYDNFTSKQDNISSRQTFYRNHDSPKKQLPNKQNTLEIRFIQTFILDGNFSFQKIQNLEVPLPFDNDTLSKVVLDHVLGKRLVKPSAIVEIVSFQSQRIPFQVVCNIKSRTFNLPQGYQASFQGILNNVVSGLRIRNSVGQVYWKQKINVADIDFSNIVEIKEGNLRIYEMWSKPPKGEGLNKQCIFTIFSCKQAEKMRGKGEYSKSGVQMKLRQMCKKSKMQFLDYNQQKNHWRVKIDPR